jgi:hypothetical protein
MLPPPHGGRLPPMTTVFHVQKTVRAGREDDDTSVPGMIQGTEVATRYRRALTMSWPRIWRQPSSIWRLQ